MKILISLETEESLKIAERVKDYVDGFKINHLLWNHRIPKYYNKETFVDCKLWDTPNTVETVVKKIIDKGATMTSICAHNNQEVFEKLKPFTTQIKLVGVISLTSWSLEVERMITNTAGPRMWESNMTRLRRYNFQAITCPVPDLRFVKSADLSGPNGFEYVCPGIVFDKETSGQTRTGSPKEAKDNGADYIILGRTVTEADNPNQVLLEIKNAL